MRIHVAVHELVLLASKCISVSSYAIHGVLYIIRTGKMSSSQWHYCGNIPIITECAIEHALRFLMTNCSKNWSSKMHIARLELSTTSIESTDTMLSSRLFIHHTLWVINSLVCFVCSCSIQYKLAASGYCVPAYSKQGQCYLHVPLSIYHELYRVLYIIEITNLAC